MAPETDTAAIIGISKEQREGEQIVDTKALVDCGAGGTFIDQQFCTKLRLPTSPLNEPLKVLNVDGTPNQEGMITHFTRIPLTINGRTKKTKLLITGLGKESIILGLPWLRKENPSIDWDLGLLEWRNQRSVSQWDLNHLRRPSFERIEEELEQESSPTWIRAKTTSAQRFAT